MMGHICENCFKEYNGKLINTIYGAYTDECDLCLEKGNVIPNEDISNIKEVINNFKVKQREDQIDDLLS